MNKGMYAKTVPYLERRAAIEPVTVGNKTCKRCGQEKAVTAFSTHANMKDGRHNKCRKCRSQDAISWFNEKGRERRTPDKERIYKRTGYMRNTLQHKVRQQTSKAVRLGVLVRPDFCSCCGGNETRIEAHHPDYTKPMEVMWLCVTCHNNEHMRSD